MLLIVLPAAVAVLLASAPAAAQAGRARPSAANPDDGGGAVEGPPPPLTDAQRFEQGQTLSEMGDCESVIRVLGDFTLGGTDKEEEQLVEAHRMLGVCYFQLGRRAEAERELKALLYLNPDYELDPFLTPPPVVELFDGLKEENRAKLEEIRRARQVKIEAQKPVTRTERVVVEKEKTVKSTPWVVLLLPFGLAQYANDEPVKAVAFFAAQLASVAVHVAVVGLLQLVHPQGLIIGDLPPQQLRTDFQTGEIQPARWPGGKPIIPIVGFQTEVATVLFGTQFLTLAIIAGVYAAGVTDALIAYEEETVVSEKERERPAEPVGTAPAAASPPRGGKGSEGEGVE